MIERVCLSVSLCSIPPTSLLPGAAYHEMGRAFLGEGLLVSTPDQLRSALRQAFSAERLKRRGRPLVINVIIDPYSSRKPQVAGNFVGSKFMLLILSVFRHTHG